MSHPRRAATLTYLFGLGAVSAAVLAATVLAREHAASAQVHATPARTPPPPPPPPPPPNPRIYNASVSQQLQEQWCFVMYVAADATSPNLTASIRCNDQSPDEPPIQVVVTGAPSHMIIIGAVESYKGINFNAAHAPQQPWTMSSVTFFH
jgi:hypothetical protein